MKTLIRHVMIMTATFLTITQATWAAEVILPTTSVVLKQSTRTWQPIKETCLTGNCGGPQSSHPRSLKQVSSFTRGWTLGGLDPVTKTLVETDTSGPVYASETVRTSVWTNQQPAGGYATESSRSHGSAWVNMGTNTITGLNVSEVAARGTLTTSTNDPNNDYSNTFTLSDNAWTAFRYVNPDSSLLYHYRIFITAQAWKATEGTMLPLVFDRELSPEEIDVHGQTVQHDANSGAYIDIDVGPESSGEVDVTPLCPAGLYITWAIDYMIGSVEDTGGQGSND